MHTACHGQIENTADPSHVPFSHHGVIGMLKRYRYIHGAQLHTHKHMHACMCVQLQLHLRASY